MKIWLLSAILACGVWACAGFIPKETSLEEGGKVLFSDRRFSVSFMEAQGITILPMANIRASEGIRENAIYEVQQAFRIYFPKTRMVSKSEVLARAKELRFEETLHTAVHDYEQSQRLDPQFIQQLHVMTQTRYFLYLRINDFDFFTKREMISKKVELEAEIWDSLCKKVVWSGRGRVSVVVRVHDERARFEEIFVSAARNLVVPLSQGKRKRAGQGECVS
jgi:hypothetical protein